MWVVCYIGLIILKFLSIFFIVSWILHIKKRNKKKNLHVSENKNKKMIKCEEEIEQYRTGKMKRKRKRKIVYKRDM